jgi:hypothetical protein
MFVAAQIVGGIAMVIVLSSHWSVERRASVMRNGAASLLFAVHYALLGLWGTMMIPLVNAARGRVFTLGPEHQWRRHWSMVPVFIGLNCGLYLAFSGPPTQWFHWMPIVGASLSTVALFAQDIRVVKGMMIIAVGAWAAYEVELGLWGVLWGELVGLVIVIVAFVRVTSVARQSSE